MLNGLDLFSGIGGFSYALREYVKPVAYCEIDPYCQALLLSGMFRGDLAKAPIWDDIRTLRHSFGGGIDIIYGGFPCQDISIAGHGKGLEGERSSLYWEMHHLAKEIKPKFIFLENVPAIRSRGGWQVVDSLAEIGYDCRWCVLSAQGCGAPHKRERWWLLAHSQHDGYASSSIFRSAKEDIRNSSKRKEKSKQFEGMDHSRTVAAKFTTNTPSEREDKSLRGKKTLSATGTPSFQSYWQKTEPPLCGVDDGVSFRVDRIRGLGNSIVPQTCKKAFEYLMGLNTW